MAILLQFVFRLAFGLSLAMSAAPSRVVPAAYFRVHLYVVFGLHVLAACLVYLQSGLSPMWVPIVGAAVSYVGTIVWYARWHRLGVLLLWALALVSLWGATNVNAVATTQPAAESTSAVADSPATATPAESTGTPEHCRREIPIWLMWADAATGGLILGSTMAAMLLGHWYLNSPGMRIGPLRRLILVIGVAVILRAAVSGIGSAMILQSGGGFSQIDWLFVSLRWLAGIGGVALVAWMSWRTLDIPNTQSATGILYVAIILAFIGELTAQLLGASLGGVV